MNATSFLSAAAWARHRAGARSSAVAQGDLVLNQFAALVLLLLASPLMLTLAFLIRASDRKPALYAHYRVGIDGRLFRCFKFRTMCHDSERVLRELLQNDPRASEEWLRDQKLADDPRITTIGRLLRRTSLDELPQLFNVLRGDMNLVGPRPITVGELTRYGHLRWHYLCVRPGITGLWQVSGRNNTTYEERVALDRRYIESRSFWNDVAILCRTAVVVVTRDGAR